MCYHHVNNSLGSSSGDFSQLTRITLLDLTSFGTVLTIDTSLYSGDFVLEFIPYFQPHMQCFICLFVGLFFLVCLFVWSQYLYVLKKEVPCD